MNAIAADLGLIATVLAALAALYACGLGILGGLEKRSDYAESARRAAVIVAPLVTLAIASVIYSNIVGNYNLEYASRVSNNDTPLLLKITALWGGQNGSMLFWCWLMSLYIFFTFRKAWDSNRQLQPWVVAISMGTQAFFIFLVLVYANPFNRLWVDAAGTVTPSLFQPGGLSAYTAPDGQGLNPLLRHPGMIIHPPMLYLGFVGLTIPFAYGMAALIAKDKTDNWIRASRRATLIAWLFLSLGLILGSRWAYDVLGWGGYWGWDPVENSALLPWLVSTAFLHSIIIQEKRGMFKIWNMVLIMLSFCLMVIGTLATRTGLLSSVHAFARSSLSAPFLAFVGFVLIGSVVLMITRGEILKSDNKLDSIFSREAAFVLNNFLFVTITFTVFIGTWYSLISEALIGQQLTVGPAVYNQMLGPQVAVLVLLMGLGPLVAWRRSSPEALGRMSWKSAIFGVIVMAVFFVGGIQAIWVLIGFGLIGYTFGVTVSEFWRGMRARHKLSGENYFTALLRLFQRNRRRYGGYLIHVGVLVMGIGVIGSLNFQQQTQRSLAPGGSVAIGNYTITFDHSLQCDPTTAMPNGCAAWYTDRGYDVAVQAAYLTVSKSGQTPIVLEPYQEIFLN
ncbi:MAG TPA: cytochrome c biogenesis protein CcsA, partial [Anaerolineae bacterium]|nr:cytochrome c biogenesis protein CcsA [Anaerolineae bacterium]